MKKFQLTLLAREDWTPNSLNIIEADDLVELCSKIPLLIIQIQRELHENEIEQIRRNSYDDIPF